MSEQRSMCHRCGSVILERGALLELREGLWKPNPEGTIAMCHECSRGFALWFMAGRERPEGMPFELAPLETWPAHLARIAEAEGREPEASP